MGLDLQPIKAKKVGVPFGQYPTFYRIQPNILIDYYRSLFINVKLCL